VFAPARKIPEVHVRHFIVATAVCVVFGSMMAPAEAARLSRDLGLWSGGDRLVRVFGHRVLRVGQRDTRGFVNLPLRPALLVGIAF
jgi:hypothetical protein